MSSMERRIKRLERVRLLRLANRLAEEWSQPLAEVLEVVAHSQRIKKLVPPVPVVVPNSPAGRYVDIEPTIRAMAADLGIDADVAVEEARRVVQERQALREEPDPS